MTTVDDAREEIEVRISGDMTREGFYLAVLGSMPVVLQVFPGGEWRAFKYRDFSDYFAHRRVMWPSAIKGGNISWSEKSIFDIWRTSRHAIRLDRGVTFRPDLPPGAQPEHGVFNTFGGFGDIFTSPSEDDFSASEPIFTHIRDVLACGDTSHYHYIVSWLADIIQRPIAPIGTALVFRGREGTGKGIIFDRLLSRIFGRMYLHLSDSHAITGRFNSALASRLLVFADEAIWAGDKAAEGKLKALITEPEITVEHKGKDVVVFPNFSRFIFASNENWVVPAGEGARRWAVFDVSDHKKGDFDYFRALSECISTHWRSFAKILAFYEYNQEDLRFIPKTDALFDQQVESLDAIAQFWYDFTKTGPWDTQFIEKINDAGYDIFDLFLVFTEYARRRGLRRLATKQRFAEEICGISNGLLHVKDGRFYPRFRVTVSVLRDAFSLRA